MPTHQESADRSAQSGVGRFIPRKLLDLNIGMKFGLIFFMLTIGFGALAYAYSMAQSIGKEAQETTSNLVQASQLADKLALSLQKARQVEKNFMLQKNSQLLEDHREALDIARGDMEALMSTETDAKALTIEEAIAGHLERYESTFAELVDSSTALGLTPKEGKLGKLRAAVHGVEKVLKENGILTLENSMLMLRRHEKDFLARHDTKYLGRFDEEVTRFNELLDAEESLSDEMKNELRAGMDVYQDTFFLIPDAYVQIEEWSSELDYILMELEPEIDALQYEIGTLAAQAAKDAEASQTTVNMGFMITLLVVGALTSVGLWLMARMIRKPLENAAEIAGAIAEGELGNAFPPETGDETGQLLVSLEQMQTGLRERIEAERVTAEENGRIRAALDNSASMVMVANSEMEIIYTNEAIRDCFIAAQSEIARDIDGFNANQLDSLPLDRLCADTVEKRQQISGLTRCETIALTLGKHHFTVKLSPLFDEDGGRMGLFAEWTDRTEEIAVEQQVEELVESSLQGDLSRRVDVDGIEGFMGRLGGRINELVAVCEHVVEDTQHLFSGMVRGDLTGAIEGEYQGSFARLKSDANATVEKLRDVVRGISASVNTVRVGAGEISLGNDNLSQRTEQQASNLEETSSSMEEMTATVKQNAEHAGQANQVASAARELAEQGGSVVEQAVSAMAEINESSDKVVDIISVIDEIAFQTNLLALNASVEAARAGEQGRGFAVVASEVRNLAGRSATAAREIKQLIEDSATKVRQGSELVNQSGETLGEIVQAVKRVNDFVGEISAASLEQSQGIEEVNKAVLQMDELTQQNAALVEESAAAAESMDCEAKELNDMIAFFHTGGDNLVAEKPNSSWQVQKTAQVQESANEEQPFFDEPVASATGTDDNWTEF